MVLGVSIGNTHAVLGLGKEKARSLSSAFCKKEHFVQAINQFVHENNRRIGDITGVICASVKPALTSVFAEAVAQIFGYQPVIVHGSMPMALDLSRYNKETIGSDRIAICEAAIARYPMPAVVFDFGTAITINVVDENNIFLGGSILSGLKMSLDALSHNTAQLPSVSLSLSSPNILLGQNTEESIISGVTFCYGAMLDGVVARIESQIGKKATVLITGGDAEVILPFCQTKVTHIPELLMEGLFLLYERVN